MKALFLGGWVGVGYGVGGGGWSIYHIINVAGWDFGNEMQKKINFGEENVARRILACVSPSDVETSIVSFFKYELNLICQVIQAVTFSSPSC